MVGRDPIRQEDAGSVVRKHFIGTRTIHGKIVSLSMEKESEGPDDKSAWKVKGTYVRGRRKRAICSCCVLTPGSTDNQVKFNQTETALALGMLKYRRRHTKAQRGAR